MRTRRSRSPAVRRSLRVMMAKDAGLSSDRSGNRPTAAATAAARAARRSPGLLRNPCSGPRTAAPAGGARKSRRRTRNSCRRCSSSSRARASSILCSVSDFIWISANSMSSWMSASEDSAASSTPCLRRTRPRPARRASSPELRSGSRAAAPRESASARRSAPGAICRVCSCVGS